MIEHLLLTLAIPAPQAAPAPATPEPTAPPLGEGVLYIEVPDLPSLLEAYESAPMVRMVNDEAVRSSVADLLESFDVDVARAVSQALQGLGVPAAAADAPLATARGLMGQVRSASLSLSLAEEADVLGDHLSKSLQATLELEDLAKQVGAFTRGNQGYPPGTLEELDLSEELLTDPWGRPYEIDVDLGTLAVQLRSLGADGQPGGEGFDADVVSDQGAAMAERLVARSLRLVLEVDFVSPEVASGARSEMVGRIEPLGWELGDPRDLMMAGAPAQVSRLGDPAVADRHVWMLQQGPRLMVGYGASSLERTLAAGGELKRLAETAADRELAEQGEALTLGGYLEPATGAIVARGVMRLGPLERLLNSVEKDIEAQSDIEIESLPFGRDGLFRMRLEGERFVTEVVSTKSPVDPDLPHDEPDFLRCVGQQPLPDSLWSFVPADAIGVLATSLDSTALYEEILKAFGAQPGERPEILAKLEQRHGFSLDEDLIANLGDGVVGYLQPITGVISIPSVALVAQLRDAERFQSGLDGLLRLLEEQAGGEFSVRYKPYRDQPLWTFTFGGQGGGMGLAGPLSVSPSLAIVEGHLIVTLTSLRAKKEIKRLLEGASERHRLLTADPVPPEDATSLFYMDWPAFLEGTYEGARAALALFGGMSDEMPFDPQVLPSGDTFTRFFRPTVSWSHQPAEGVRRTRIESSFGPETWLAILSGSGALALGIESRSTTTVVVRREERFEEDPERAAAIARTELTLAEVATRLEVFRIESGRYPRELAELLVPTDNFPRGYLERDSVPLDGWERELVYLPSTDGGSYSLWSLGEDGVDERGGGDDVRVD
jgi:hypothetical protein